MVPRCLAARALTHSPPPPQTHAWRPHCPKGARYVHVSRDPADVAVSFFKFFEGWFFEAGHVSLDEFVRQFWLGRGRPASDDWMTNASAWDHLLSWWPHRNDADVHFISFEDLKADLPAEVARLAAFLGVEVRLSSPLLSRCHRSPPLSRTARTPTLTRSMPRWPAGRRWST